MSKVHLYLAIAIVAEVVATSALKASDNFSRTLPSILVIGGYATAFHFLSIVVKTMPVGLAYAIWSGAGIVLVALVSMVVYRQIPDFAAWAGMAMIIAGIIVLNLFSNMGGH